MFRAEYSHSEHLAELTPDRATSGPKLQLPRSAQEQAEKWTLSRVVLALLAVVALVLIGPWVLLIGYMVIHDGIYRVDIDAAHAKVQIGMSMDEVRATLGPPNDDNYPGHSGPGERTWWYSDGTCWVFSGLYVTFDARGFVVKKYTVCY